MEAQSALGEIHWGLGWVEAYWIPEKAWSLGPCNVTFNVDINGLIDYSYFCYPGSDSDYAKLTITGQIKKNGMKIAVPFIIKKQ